MFQPSKKYSSRETAPLNRKQKFETVSFTARNNLAHGTSTLKEHCAPGPFIDKKMALHPSPIRIGRLSLLIREKKD
jgi:hypothetical protein